MKRSLSKGQRTLIARIAEALPALERSSVLADLEIASVADVSDDGAITTFELPGYARDGEAGQRPFGVEGSVRDRDGAKVSILLHADVNGRLYQLELVRFADGPLMDPDWSTLEVF